MLEREGNFSTLRYINHTVTLAKSKQDAEEEQELKRQETLERTSQYHPSGNFGHIDDGINAELQNDHMSCTADYLAMDITTTVSAYMRYENPFIHRLNVHNYVFDALATAKKYGILLSTQDSIRIIAQALVNSDNARPSALPCQILSTSPSIDLSVALHQSITELNRSLPIGFWIPLSLQQQKDLKDSIKNAIQSSRNLSTTSLTPTLALHSSIVAAEPLFSSFMADSSNNRLTAVGFVHRFRIRHEVNEIIMQTRKAFNLNSNQLLCFHFVVNRLALLLVGESIDSLSPGNLNRCLYMGGAGGTGKSQVIRAVVHCFAELNCGHRLLVAATTGVAAISIRGSTIDSLCKLKRKTSFNDSYYDSNCSYSNDFGNGSSVIGGQWVTCQFLILDEVSNSREKSKF